MAKPVGKCPIWGTSADVRDLFDVNAYRVESLRAGGRYVVSREAIDDYLNNSRVDDRLKARLTTWLVDQRRLGTECPNVTSEIVEEAKRHRPLPVHERADRLLERLAVKSSTIGDAVAIPKVLSRYAGSTLSQQDEIMHELLAVTESITPQEVNFLASYLQQRNWISERTTTLAGPTEFVVTVDGYSRLAELAEASINVTQAFVAMWFEPSMDDVYSKGIALGIADAGYKPVRIDRKDHNNKIDDEIIAEIRRSRFLVADFTQAESGARGGVYYEAGFAHGLNIPVIFTCRDEVIDKVHFDTRQYNHITWKTPEDLRSRVAQRISATIGDGPVKKLR